MDFDLNADLGLIISTDTSTFSVKQKETGSGVFGDLNAITGTPRSGVLADSKISDWSYSFYSGDINGYGFPDLIAKWGGLRNGGGQFYVSSFFVGFG